MKLAAGVAGGQVYTSTDGGTNWTARDSSRFWDWLASSADGSKWIAAVNGGDIYTAYQGAALAGGQGASIELTYAGGGVWQPLNLAQVSANPALLHVNQTFTGQNTFNNPANRFVSDGSGLSDLRLTGFSTVTPNRLRSIETPGNEQLYVRAARNLDMEAPNDATFWAGRNFTMTVDNDISLHGKHDMTVAIDNGFSETIALNYGLTVGANITLALGSRSTRPWVAAPP
jgi:hypothetical protein